MRLEQSGALLHVDLNIILDDVKVKSTRGVDFIPQLISSSNTYELPRYLLKVGMSIWRMNGDCR